MLLLLFLRKPQPNEALGCRNPAWKGSSQTGKGAASLEMPAWEQGQRGELGESQCPCQDRVLQHEMEHMRGQDSTFPYGKRAGFKTPVVSLRGTGTWAAGQESLDSQ